MSSRSPQALKARGVRCFYDADEQIELWGKYLAEELPAIYGEQAAAVVVFVSAEYAARDWTRLERRAALDRAVRERREYVLPARFDDTPLPGLLSDMVAVDLRGRTPQQFAAMIADKLAALGITSAAPADAGAPPRTPSRRVRRGRCGWARPTRGGWACMRRSACRGCRMRSCRSTCRGMPMPPSPASGPGWRPRRSGAGSCCWSAGPRSARPGARRRRSGRCCRTGGWCTRPGRPRSPRWRRRRRRGRWCGWMSCSATWTASTG